MLRFVSSLPDAKRLSKGKYTKVWHFDSKAAVEDFVRHDPAMVSAGLSQKSSFIHVGVYVDNWRRSSLEMVKDPESSGYYRVQVSDGREKLPLIWIHRDTGPLVKKLVEDVQPGARLLGVSKMASYREYFSTWARVLGKELAGDQGIKQVSPEEYAERVKGDKDHKEHMLETWEFAAEFGYDGGDPEMLYPKDVSPPTISFSTYGNKTLVDPLTALPCRERIQANFGSNRSAQRIFWHLSRSTFNGRTGAPDSHGVSCLSMHPDLLRLERGRCCAS